jgi:hypothetical protein
VPALEALLPLPPHLVVQRIEKAVQGCPARVPRPVQATRLCGQDDAPCLPQRGGTSEHALTLIKGQEVLRQDLPASICGQIPTGDRQHVIHITRIPRIVALAANASHLSNKSSTLM